MTSATERRATPWTMRSLREELARKRRDPQAFAVTIFLSDLESLLADADALAGALADAARYRAALEAVRLVPVPFTWAGDPEWDRKWGQHEYAMKLLPILNAALRGGRTGAALAPDDESGTPRRESPAALLRRLRAGGLLICDHDGIERVEYPGDGTLRLALCGGGAVAFRLADAGTARNAGAEKEPS